MKTKENLETKNFCPEKTPAKTKLRSLRPMRSLVATRSFKPRTHVANLVVKSELMEKRD